MYPTDTARTLGTDKPDPAGNQGGVAIVERDSAYSLQGSMIGRADENGPQGNGINEDVSFTLNTCDRHAVAHPIPDEPAYIVRRLTPLECCRLQGFPDWWEDGAEGSDSARYKMWGNGIALPCAVDVLRRIAKEGGTDHAEMAAEKAAAP